jgi:hypothetical protein
LTGWKAPAAGGPTSKQLSPEQKTIDRQARLTISRELGHEREQITAVYLGQSAVMRSKASPVSTLPTASQKVNCT